MKLTSILFALLFLSTAAFAQRTSDTDDYFDEGLMLRDRIWYGSGGRLNFFGVNGQNAFQIGLTPMVGYKIIERVSVGPRIGVIYTTQRAPAGNQIVRFNSWDFEYGVFGRVKILPVLFFHSEYSVENRAFPTATFKPGTNRLESTRQSIDHAYIGAGYQSGGGRSALGYELMLLFDVLDDQSTTRLPIDFRVGLNYNF